MRALSLTLQFLCSLCLVGLLTGCGKSSSEQQEQVDSRVPSVVLPNDMTLAELTAGQATLVQIEASVSNPNLQAIRYSWSLVQGTGIDVSGFDSNVIEFLAPDVKQDSEFELKLTATDTTGASGSDTIKLTVTKINNAPKIQVAEKIRVPERSPFTLPATISDVDGDPVQASWALLDGRLGTDVELIDSQSGALEAKALSVEQNTSLEFQLTATDSDGASTQAKIIVEILNDDEAPGGVVLVSGSALGRDSLVLDWLEGQDNLNQSDDLTYRLHLSQSSGFIPSADTLYSQVSNRLSQEVTGLEANTEYFALIEVEDISGNRALSNQISVRTLSKSPSLNPDQPVVSLSNFRLEGSSLTYEFDDASSLPQVGDVVVSGQDSGLMRRVESVATSGNTATIATSGASVSQVYQELALASRVKLIQLEPNISQKTRRLAKRGLELQSKASGVSAYWPDSRLTLTDRLVHEQQNSTTSRLNRPVEASNEQVSGDSRLRLTGPKYALFRPGVSNQLQVSAESDVGLAIQSLSLVALSHASIREEKTNFGATSTETRFSDGEQRVDRSLVWTPEHSQIDTEHNQAYLAHFRANLGTNDEVEEVVNLTVKIYVGYALPSKTLAYIEAQNADVRLKVRSEFNLEPNINIQADVSDGQLTQALASLSGFADFDAEIEIEGSQAGSVESTQTLVDRTFVKVATGGDVPVVVHGRFRLEAQVSATITEPVNLSHSLMSGLALQAGFEYKNNDWQPIAQVLPTLTYQIKGQGAGLSQGEIKLVPRLEMGFFERSAATIELEPSLYARAEVAGRLDTLGSSEASARLQALEAGLSAKVRVQGDLTPLDASVGVWPSASQWYETQALDKTALVGAPVLEELIASPVAGANSCLFEFKLGVTPIGDAFSWLPESLTWSGVPDLSASAQSPLTDQQYASQGLLAALESYTLEFSGYSELGSWARQSQFLSLDNRDQNDDGLPDYWAQHYALTQAEADIDGDGLSNLQEFEACTLPTQADSDGDGMTDGEEVQEGLDVHRDDADEDLDGDGRSNITEIRENTPVGVANLAPQVEIQIIEYDENRSRLHLRAMATDSDGHIQSYLWLEKTGQENPGQALDLGAADTAEIEIQLPYVESETQFKFNVLVTDNEGASASANSDIAISVVERVNTPPTVRIVEVANTLEGNLVTLDGSESADLEDESKTDWTYAWSQIAGPEVTLSHADAPLAQFHLPELNADTQFKFQLVITDSEGLAGSASLEFTGLNRINAMPLVNAGPDLTKVERRRVLLDGSATSDAEDGTELTYLWRQIDASGIAVGLQTANLAQAYFVAPEVDEPKTLIFELVATDSELGQGQDTVAVTLVPAELDPSLALVGHWPLEGETNEAIGLDASGNGTNASVTGAPQTVMGVNGQGLKLDGLEDGLTVQDLNLFSSGAMSLAFWLKVETLPTASQVLFTKAGVLELLFNTDGSLTLTLQLASGGTTSIQLTMAESGLATWQAYAYTLDPVTGWLRTYRNGELVQTLNIEASGLAVSDAAFYMATRSGETTVAAAQGELDEIYVYDRALDPLEVRLLAERRSNALGYSWQSRFSDSELLITNQGVSISGSGYRLGGYACTGETLDLTQQQVQLDWQVSQNDLAVFGFQLLDASRDWQQAIVDAGPFSTDYALDSTSLITAGAAYTTYIQLLDNDAVLMTTSKQEEDGSKVVIRQESLPLLRTDADNSQLILCFGLWNNYGGTTAKMRVTSLNVAEPIEWPVNSNDGPALELADMAGKILLIRGESAEQHWAWAIELLHRASDSLAAVSYFATKSKAFEQTFEWQSVEASWQLVGNTLQLSRGGEQFELVFEDGQINQGESLATEMGDNARIADFYLPTSVATTGLPGHKLVFLGAPNNSIFEFEADGTAKVYDEGSSTSVTLSWQLTENETQVLFTDSDNNQFGFGNYSEFTSFMPVYGQSLSPAKFLLHIVGNPIVEDAFAELSFDDPIFAACVRRLAQYYNWQSVTDVVKLNCSGEGISSAQGIELFTSLQELNLSHNLLTSIDISANAELKILNLADNRLTEINLDSNRALHTATLVNNPFTQATLDYLASIDWIANLLYGDASATPVITSTLTDTGITTCANETQNGLACPVAEFRGQDGEYGRDDLALDGELQKVGSGKAAFDYTKLDANGNELADSASVWACVRDNVTGLIWEVKATDGGIRDMGNTYTWYNSSGVNDGGEMGTENGGVCTDTDKCDTEKFVTSVNVEGLCGAKDWRLPEKEELRSLVHYGAYLPAIDKAFFPNTQSAIYWSRTPVARDGNLAWNTYFNYGDVYYSYKTGASYVRLVRGGQ